MSNSTRGAWLLSVPAYDGGIYSQAAYNIGYGKSIQPDSETGRMQLIAKTTAEEFSAYVAKLVAAGYEKIFENEIGGNRYAQLLMGDGTVYAYFVKKFSEVRVIEDRASCPIDRFGYTQEGDRDSTAIYQYAMMYAPPEEPGFSTPHQIGGMFYILRLSDNRLILIDGGWETQATEQAVPEALQFLYDVSGTPADEKLRIAAVIITHPHGDHKAFTHHLLSEYPERFDVERFCYNIQSFANIGGHNPTYPDFGAMVCQNYPDALFLKPHTGQRFTLGELSVEVLFTGEDMVTADAAELSVGEVNNTTVVMKFTIHGKTFMLLGDVGTKCDNRRYKIVEEMRVEGRFLGMYQDSDGSFPKLQSDMVQVSHHSVNFRMSNYYYAIRARSAMIPTCDLAYEDFPGSFYYRVIHQLLTCGAREVLMAGRRTYWYEIGRDGSVRVDSEPIRGASDEYLAYLDRYRPLDLTEIPLWVGEEVSE